MNIFTKKEINIYYDTDYDTSNCNCISFVEDLLFYKDLYLLNNNIDEFNQIVYDYKYNGEKVITNKNLYKLYDNYCYNINKYHKKTKNLFFKSINHLIKNKGGDLNNRWVQF